MTGVQTCALPICFPVTIQTDHHLDRVFFTADIGLARIYAGRAARSIGGDPVLYRVVCPVDVVCMNDDKGASVYHAAWAFCEEL